MLKKILIANRGEIAIRVMKACKELGILTVAIFAENDRSSGHVSYADEAYNLGTGALKDTYLNIEKITGFAIDSGAEAIHPGYGFLSENAGFARACEEKNIVFIGPTADVMEAMGDKLRARAYMKEAGVPLTPGTEKGVKSVEEVLAFGEKHGYPIALKASAGGGGRGLRPVHDPDQAAEALEGAMREGKNYFGDDTVFVEKFLPHPRHIEVQILGDNYGNIIHAGERNCSIQRRHQKLVEESPSPYLLPEIRQQILSAAVKGAAFLKYRSAGTFEFLEQDGSFYFMEVNARLQVEHPVTEMIYGIDLVKEQISIASGNKLSYSQEDIKPRGHAIECRITVEDAKSNFRPTAGLLEEYTEPTGFGVRCDSIGRKGWTVPSEYDSMIGKLIVWDEDRERAINKAYRALNEFTVSGVPTTIGFHKWVMKNQEFIEGNYSTNFIPVNFKPEFLDHTPDIPLGPPSNGDGREEGKKEKETLEIEVNNKLFKVVIYQEKEAKAVTLNPSARMKKKGNAPDSHGHVSDTGEITAPMASTVVKILVENNSLVKQGQVLLVLEAMKMETDILSPQEGTVKEIKIKPGDTVSAGEILLTLE
jgi:acetyl-CoA/propionyl-CoA carboxylase biotin carboxyl carrier protein